MLHISKRFLSIRKKTITRNMKGVKMKKIVDKFFKQNDKNGTIREALKIDQEFKKKTREN
jgi:hypothetical protein